jgi:hypothetical protein
MMMLFGNRRVEKKSERETEKGRETEREREPTSSCQRQLFSEAGIVGNGVS